MGLHVRTVDGFVEGLVTAAPRIASGLLFLAIAAVAIRLAMWFVRRALERSYRGDDRLIADFAALVVAAVLWFGALLAFLSIVGLEEVAAGLGTATGFLALGVAYALSQVLADAVAGVYLLRDPDYAVGDRVTIDGSTGTLAAIGLRKSRIDLDDGDRLVVGNSDVEHEWRRVGGGG